MTNKCQKSTCFSDYLLYFVLRNDKKAPLKRHTTEVVTYHNFLPNNIEFLLTLADNYKNNNSLFIKVK